MYIITFVALVSYCCAKESSSARLVCSLTVAKIFLAVALVLLAIQQANINEAIDVTDPYASQMLMLQNANCTYDYYLDDYWVQERKDQYFYATKELENNEYLQKTGYIAIGLTSSAIMFSLIILLYHCMKARNQPDLMASVNISERNSLVESHRE